MIFNERQFRIAKDQMEKFKFSITNFDMESLVNNGTDRLIAQAQLDQLQSEYEILPEQIKEIDLNIEPFDIEKFRNEPYDPSLRV